tara:strand:+ start:191 stop:1861 length:1671 start_codon:yes stop_codon:yes gene_type:complete
MSSANKVTVNKTTNVVTVVSSGTVGPQGGSGTIESATASATAVAVSNLGISGSPTAAVTLGGTAEARTMAFAFGVPTGASAHTAAPLTIGEDDTGYDVTFFGDTSGSFLKWDASEDALELTDSTPFKIGDDTAGDMTLYHNGTDSYITNKTGELKLATETSDIAVKIGHTTSETTVNDNLTVTGDLTVSGTTTTVNTTVTISDAVVVNNAGTDIGLKVNSTSSGHIMQLQDNGTDVLVVADGGTTTATAFAGPLTGAVTGNASTATALQTARTIGGVSFDGTANINLAGVNTAGNQATSGNAATATALQSARNIGGVSFDGTGNINLPGVNTAGNQDTSGTATTATTATNITAVANDSTNETTYPTFVDGATGAQGIETDTGLTYNPSSGLLTAAGFAGPITGAVTGNASTATALATGRTVGMTGDVVWTSPSFDGSGNVTAVATIQANSVALGTDTTGNYTATVTAGTGLTSTGATSGEGIAHSLSVDASQTQITSVGALNAGSITSGFGTIDTGSSNITTTGTASATTFVGALTGTASGNDILGSAIAMSIALG